MKLPNQFNHRLDQRLAVVAFLMLLPFIIFYWLIPFASNISLGNDYPRYPLWEQMELMFSLHSGSFPLYVPGYCGGQTASALTLGQLYHPLSHIASILPGYWNGYALEWNTFLRLLSLGIVHVSLYTLLLKLNSRPLWAFLISLITVYNLRMLDLFRYGASLESWTGHLMLCTVIGFYCIRRRGYLLPMALSLCVYWLLTSGHPQMMYYGLFGAGIFTMLIPHVVNIMLPGRHTTLKEIYRFYLKVAIFLSMGVALSAAYIGPFYFDFLLTNSGRFAQDYTWSLSFQDSFFGTLNNFFYPLRSDVHGAFGGTPLLLAGILLPFISRFKIEVPWVIWGIWGVILIVFLYMQGDRTGLHYFAWKTIPFASSVRIAERISMVLPILFMLILAWGFNTRPFNIKVFNHDIQLMPLVAASLAALVLTVIFNWADILLDFQPSVYSALSIRNIPAAVESGIQVVGFLSLLSLILYSTITKFRMITAAVMASFFILYSGLLLYHGTWVEAKRPTPSFAQIAEQKKLKLDYQGLPGAGLASVKVMQHIALTSLDPFMCKLYRKWMTAESSSHAYDIIQTVRKPDQVVLENGRSLSQDDGDIQTAFKDRVDLIYSSYNRIVFDIEAGQKGFLVLAYPFSGHWQARVNGNPASLIRANGMYQAVVTQKGPSRIEFRYQSRAAFWGMLISCLTLGMVAAGIGWFGIRNRSGRLFALLIIILAATVFITWHKSLYNGRNLGTDYSWTSIAEATVQNLAHGKQSRLPQINLQLADNLFYSTRFNHFSSSGKAVDGETALNSGFVTQTQRDPWYLIDMHQKISSTKIAIYEGKLGPGVNTRPLQILCSNDLKNWRSGGRINDPQPRKRPQEIHLASIEPFRYLLITATGISRLALDEVEVYPASEQ